MTELKAIKVNKEKQREKGKKITDLAGSWDVTDEEAEEIKASISQAWETCKPQKQSSSN